MTHAQHGSGDGFDFDPDALRDRYRRERDELSEALRIERQTSQALRRELEQLRGGDQPDLGLPE